MGSLSEEKSISIVDLIYPDVTSGAMIIYENNTSLTANTEAYVIKKGFKCQFAGVVNVKFGLDAIGGGAGTAYGRIYVNAVATGTERTTTLESVTNYEEDITVALGDVIYVKGKIVDTSGHISNFALKTADGRVFNGEVEAN